VSPNDQVVRSPGPAVAWAWCVHAYTALGAIAAFAAVLAIVHRDYKTAFLWLVGAVVIDASDGALARLANVKERTPAFDGARLDDIVDYLTYVFAPVLLLYLAGTLPPRWGFVVAAIVLLSSAYGFASTDAKADDHFFTGFPSYWNVAAVYLFAARLAPVVNGFILLGLSALVFVRIGYVYPSRTPILRGLTVTLAAAWAAMMIAIVLTMPGVPQTLLIGSLFFPVYYTVLSLVLHSRRRRT
jgi:phosphatidylcholine synthase